MSLDRLADHRSIWAAKPVLRSVYEVWFEALLATLGSRDRVVEVGAGPGFLAAHARARRPGVRWVASDVIAAPWNDLVADAHRLPLEAGGVDALLGVDVVHHLARPGDFFAEAARVLSPSGRVAVVEPWITPLSYPIYRWLHQEGCRAGLDPWNPFPRAGKDAFQGDGAVVWKLAREVTPARWGALGFAAPRVTVLNGFAYLLSLGFKRGSLLPPRLLPPLLRLDARTAGLARWVGLRALVVWERRPSPAAVAS